MQQGNYSHVVVLAKGAEVLVQLLNPLLVRLDTFALQAFIEL